MGACYPMEPCLKACAKKGIIQVAKKSALNVADHMKAQRMYEKKLEKQAEKASMRAQASAEKQSGTLNEWTMGPVIGLWNHLETAASPCSNVNAHLRLASWQDFLSIEASIKDVRSVDFRGKSGISKPDELLVHEVCCAREEATLHRVPISMSKPPMGKCPMGEREANAMMFLTAVDSDVFLIRRSKDLNKK